MGTALSNVMKNGVEKVSDRQAKGALAQAVNRIANLSKRADKTKEVAAKTGAAVVHTAETQGSLFLASMAEGYFGGDKLKVGGLDLRAPVAVLAQGYGIYETMSGKGGGHSLAIGNGVMASWLASVAVSAGRKLKAGKSDAPAPTGMQGELPGVSPTGVLPAPPELAADLAGPVRDVVLTPEPVARSHRNPSRDGRFVRARTD